MASHQIERMRYIDGLLDKLLDLGPVERESSLAELDAHDPILALELRRLLGLCASGLDLNPAGGLSGALAQECLIGLARPKIHSIGERIGPYFIDGLLGRGGMADVYNAYREFDGFSQHVALKLVRPGSLDLRLSDRVLQEQRALVRLSHPHIARFLDAGVTEDGQTYTAMELVEGTEITEFARATNASVRTKVGWIIDLCGALAHAHAHLIVHCDIKPSNVLIDRGGRLKLLDFGIAHTLEERAIENDGIFARYFTPDYAAPEQVAGETATTATDVFQVGALLYHLLVGNTWLPAIADSKLDKFAAILTTTPTPPSLQLRLDVVNRSPQQNERKAPASVVALAMELQGPLDAIILKCLKRRPGERYATIDQLERDLRNWLLQRPVTALPTGNLGRLSLWAKRHKMPLVLAGAALLCVAVIASYSLRQVSMERENKAREQVRAQAVESFLAKVFLQASPYMKEEPNEALSTLTKVGDALLTSEPNLDTRTRLRLTASLARLELDNGAAIQSEARLRKALSLSARENILDSALVFELRHLLGLAMVHQDRVGEALRVFEDARTTSTIGDIEEERRALFFITVGDLHRREGRIPAAKKYFDPAMKVLASDELPLSADYLEAVLRAATYLDQSGGGRDPLHQIASRLRNPQASSAESSVLRARRFMTLSYVEMLLGQAGEAGEHARAGASGFAAILGPDHHQVIKARAYACSAFRDAWNLEPAEEQCAAALQSLKRRHKMTSDDATVLRLNLAGIYFSSGRFKAAQEQLIPVLDSLDPHSAPYQYLFAKMLLGRIRYRQGHADVALHEFGYASRLQRKHFPDHKELIAHIAEHTVPALIASKRFNEAERMLDTEFVAVDTQEAWQKQLEGVRLKLRAQLAAALGHRQTAIALTSESLSAFRLSEVSSNERAWILLESAETLLQAGDIVGAQRLLEDAGKHLNVNTSPGLWSWATLRLGQITPGSNPSETNRQALRIFDENFGSQKPLAVALSGESR